MTSRAQKPQGMVDKIAEEIWLAHPMGWETFGGTPLPWHSVENIWGDQYRRAARAAVGAIREPSHGMIAGSAAVRKNVGAGFGIRLWKSMIDAILAEKST